MGSKQNYDSSTYPSPQIPIYLSVYQSSSSIADRLSASPTQSILSQKEKNGNSIKITVLLWLSTHILIE
jgi:hypothetical protein